MKTPFYTFLKISAWSLVVTALTTFVAHLVNFPTPDFESSLLLARNWAYILRNDIIILHCVLVIVSMLGLALLGDKEKRGWLALGLLCFIIFGLAEITRMTLANVVVNGLREQHLVTSEVYAKDVTLFLLQNVWPLVGEFLFKIFILAFGLGCIFYGFAFWQQHWTGRIFFIWGLVNLVGFTNDFMGVRWIATCIEYFSIVFQPLARLWIGVWFLKEIHRQKAQQVPV